MLSRIYWMVTAIVLAIVVHVSYVVIAPTFVLERSIVKTRGESGPNKFYVLPVEDQHALFPSFPRNSVFGLCSFDVSKSGVELSANMPDTFWTLTVYSHSGDVIYALNNMQSGTNAFTVSLTRAPGLLEMLTRVAPENPKDFTGWNVSTADATGIAVMWVPLREPAQRRAITHTIESSSCKGAA